MCTLAPLSNFWAWESTVFLLPIGLRSSLIQCAHYELNAFTMCAKFCALAYGTPFCHFTSATFTPASFTPASFTLDTFTHNIITGLAWQRVGLRQEVSELRQEIMKLQQEVLKVELEKKHKKDLRMPVLEKDRKLLWKEIKGLRETVKVLPGLKEMIQTLQELVAELCDRAEIFGEMANWRIRAINPKASA